MTNLQKFLLGYETLIDECGLYHVKDQVKDQKLIQLADQLITILQENWDEFYPYINAYSIFRKLYNFKWSL